MNENLLFCVIGIIALAFCIFTDVQTIRTRMEHKERAIGRIIFCAGGILLLVLILVG